MSIHLIKNYLSEVERIIHFGGSRKETSIRNAFQRLLDDYARQKGLMLIPEISIKTKQGRIITPDGTLKDSLRQDWGYWESKDEADDLNEEIRKKFAKDYPNNNILFEDSQTAILFQNGTEVLRVSMRDEQALDQLLTRFVHFERPEVTNFRKAIELFKQDVPKVTDTLRDMLQEQENINPKFVQKRDEFLKLCHDSINPDVTKADVHEMMIQHVLTEDIFNTIFDETQFHRENNIARQLESVLATFFTGATRRTALSAIQHYYQVINAAAAGIADHHEKQKFLKVVYETFYKSYNPKAADRLGVVYTPNEIVKFMIESTDYLLHKHFGKFLEDPGVDILDPATGTGTFVCDLIDYIRKDKLAYKYAHELHANEVAILPYYISNLNIEYTYKQKMGAYAEYENLCFVDTLDNMGFAFRGKQMDLFAPFTEENTQRIKKQNDRKIAVIIGNPPYNAKQENYNFQNANRGYTEIDKRIKDTYIKYGTAQNQIVVYDMYTRFIRWASDRLDDNGIIAFVSNSSFIDGQAFDGFRKAIGDEFNYCYVINLKGNARTSGERRRQEGGNIFQDLIRVGVAIYFFVRKKGANGCSIFYDEIEDYVKGEDKLAYISHLKLENAPLTHLIPDKNNNWINLADNDFDTLLPLCDKKVKAGKSKKAIFELFSNGIKTGKDEWLYDFSLINEENKISYLLDVYKNCLENSNYSDKFKIKWDENLQSALERKINIEFKKELIIKALYRPFSKRWIYFEPYLIQRTYQWVNIIKKESNLVINFHCVGSDNPLFAMVSEGLIDLGLLKMGNGGTFSLPLYRYDAAGNRHDNLTDWGLNQFTKHYKTKKITKEEVFHYVYAVLHHPEYRTKYELNLKREFPRVPLYDDFWQWAGWGKQLLDLHIGYETVAPYELKRYDAQSMLEIRSRSESSKKAASQLGDIMNLLSGNDNPDANFPPGYQFKVKLKADKENGSIQLDERTTLRGIPAEAWLYKLGNRSALEWILDQYKESKPKDPTIAEHFNTYRFADYKEQVIDLLKRVTTVSVETMRIVGEMG